MKTILPLLLPLSACGIIDLTVSNQTVSANVSATSQSCDGEMRFIDATFTLDELKKREAGFRACIKSLDAIDMTGVLTRFAPAASCEGPQGTLSAVEYRLGYTGADGKSREIQVPCDVSTIELGDQAAFEAQLNTCLDAIAAEQTQLIEALNSPEPSIHLYGVGQCSPNACFDVGGTVTVKLSGIKATNCL